MANTDKALKVSITGDASQLGAATKQAVGQLNELKTAANSVFSAFVGGLAGGALAGSIGAIGSMLSTKLAEANRLLDRAERLGLSNGRARSFANLESAAGLSEGVLGDASANLRSAVQEAMAGDPNFRRAFEKLGIAADQLASANNDDRLLQVLEKFRQGPVNANTRGALATLIGSGAEAEVAPYALGGLFREKTLMSVLGLPFLGGVASYGLNPGGILQGLFGIGSALNNRKVDLEPRVKFGQGDEIRAKRMSEENDQRELANKRALLSIEEQIKAVVEEKARLEKEMAATNDVVEKQRIRSNIISLDSDRQRLEVENGRRPNLAMVTARTDVDDFARRGLFVGGGRGMGLQEQSLARLTAIEQVLRDTKVYQRETL